MELCGIDGYHGIQGVSQVPVLDDPSASVRDSVLVEDDLDLAPTGRFPTDIRSLITPTHRYSRFDTGEEGLDELGSDDDDERTNLATSDPGSRAEHMDRLADALIAHGDKSRGAPMATV